MGMSLWLVWFIIAAFFIVAEILTAGFFLFWFGIGAAIAGLLALLGVDLIWQLIGFIGVSLILFLVSRRFAERISKEQPPGIGADRFIGKECVVLEEISRHDHTGRVRMGSEDWRAESESGETIPKGTRVTVTRTSGTRLVVEPLGEGD